MDSITHIALGAVIGEAIAGKGVGKRVLLVGAAAQSLPDIDFVAGFWMSPAENLLVHRGITHSFLFAVLLSLLLAVVACKSNWLNSGSFKEWTFFFFLQMTVHILLDSLNAYGVGLFEPFSDERISMHVLFVADPFFSLPIIGSALALLLMRIKPKVKVLLVISSLSISLLYLFYAFYNKHTIDKQIEAALATRQFAYNRFLATPTPLNTWLWFIAVETDSGFHITHRSVLDRRENLEFHYFPQHKELLNQVDDNQSVKQLIRFSEGFYTVSVHNDTLLFNDLRFGQITGWSTPSAQFVFHYYLQHPGSNAVVIQRGRFANWNRKTVKGLVYDILGKD